MNTQTIVTDYNQQSIDFLKANGIQFKAVYIKHGRHFDGEKETRDIWLLSLIKGSHEESFRFRQSIASSNRGKTKPLAYDLLASLTKSDPGDFEDFCSEYGYSSDSRSAYATWENVTEEWDKVNDFFTPEELEQLMEIQ